MSGVSQKLAPATATVVIESVTKCYGNCDGCALTEQQRLNDVSNMGSPMDWATRYARSVFSRVRRQGPGDVGFLNFAQGEHLEVDPVTDIVEWAEKALPRRDILSLFTTALLMPTGQARSLLSQIHERSVASKVSMVPTILFSPKKLLVGGFRQKYLQNIDTATEFFGTTDLALNLGPDIIDLVGAQQFNDFMLATGFRTVEINVAITQENAAVMGPRYREIIGWMRDVAALWLRHPQKYRLPYMINFARFSRDHHGEELSAATDFLVEHLTRHMYLTLDGNAYLAASGGAGPVVPLHTPSGFAPVQSGFAEFDITAVEQYARVLVARLSVVHQRYGACRSCPHAVSCVASGFSVALRLLRIDAAAAGERCPLGVFEVMEMAHEAQRVHGFETLESYRGAVLQRGLLTPEDEASGRAEPNRWTWGRTFEDVIEVDADDVGRRRIDIPVVVQRDR